MPARGVPYSSKDSYFSEFSAASSFGAEVCNSAFVPLLESALASYTMLSFYPPLYVVAQASCASLCPRAF